MKYFIELNDSQSKIFWWRVMARNGQVLLTSETYTRASTRTRIANKFSKATGIPVRLGHSD